MKVLFLDHDGVICLQSEWGTRFKKQRESGGRLPGQTFKEVDLDSRFDNFNKKAVQVLNEILEKTGAEIVVSSDWRSHATLEEMGEVYTKGGIIKKPIGYTTISLKKPENFPWRRDFELEQTRSLEIFDWLENHPEVTHWVAVDDLDMGRDGKNWGLPNFAWTPKENEGIKQTGVKDKILKFLSND